MKINILKEIKDLLTLSIVFDNILGLDKFDENTIIEDSNDCVLGHEKLSLEKSNYNLVRKNRKKEKI